MSTTGTYRVISKVGCPNCDIAIMALQDAGFTPEVTKPETKEKRQAALDAAGQRTFPIVYAPDGTTVGGAKETLSHLRGLETP